MKPKTIIIICAAMLAVLGILAAVVLGSSLFTEPTYETRIRNAEKYLSEGNLDQAILEDKAAIELDETNPEAYIGLATVYRRGNYSALARQTLEQGLSLTGSERLRNALAEYQPNQQPAETDPIANPNPGGKDGEAADPVLNRELLQFLSGATYRDYQNKYSDLNSRMEGDRCIARTSQIPADLIFYDTTTVRVLNPSTQQPYPESVPNEIHFDDICVLFGGVEKIPYTALQTMNGILNLRTTGSVVEFEAAGCKFRVSCDSDLNIQPGAENQLTPTAIVTVVERTINGYVVDASTGYYVDGAALTFWNSAAGERVETVTEPNGSYQVEVSSSGEYEVTVAKEGYIEESFSVYVPEGGQELTANFTISPVVGEDVIRIVLTWGASPSDLDSYLIGTASDGTHVEISYHGMTAYSGGNKIAELDVDDMSSYGPETITLYDIHGNYEFSVVDYTNTIGVGPSGAEVKIYKGDSLLYTVRPDSGIGRGWKVCRIRNGEVTIVNEEQSVVNGMPV